MKNSLSIIKIFLITFLIFILLDFLTGKYIYNKFVRSDFIDVDTSFGERDDIYDHKFKKNNNSVVGWGKFKYNLCTDSNGFRNSCKNQFSSLKEFDLAFLGDSFTEPVGMNFENSFVGIISSQMKEKRIANLAASSYSPSIHFAKMNFLLSKGYKFKEIIVFIDLSDIVDDAVCYKLNKHIIERRNSYSDCFKQNLNLQDKISDLFKERLRLSYEIYRLTKATLINNNLINYKVPDRIVNHPRSNWTHNYKKENYNNFSYVESTNILLSNMEKLSKLLKDNKIDLSIAIYPWPGTLKYDSEDNKQVEIWKDFCTSRCKKFYNFMKPFYNLLKYDEFTNVYRKIYIENDQHFNEEGHKIIAENFLKLYKD